MCNKCSAKCAILQSKIYIKNYICLYFLPIYTHPQQNRVTVTVTVAQFFCEYILF